jgi:hypothetical protein
MPKPEPPAVIRISTNCIVNNRFYKVGEALPFENIDDLPPNLKPLVVSGEPGEPDEEPEADEPRSSFRLNEIYRVRDDGRLGRQLQRRAQRDIAEMEEDAAREEWIEETANSTELPAEVAQDLEAEHRRHVAQQTAQLAADANRSDAASDAAAEAGAVPTLYVRRGSRHYAPALKARLKAGESVFIRQPDGRFEFVGEVDGHGQLPISP